MKLKKVKIVVESHNKTKSRWLKALKGKIKQTPNEEIICIESWDLLGKIFSASKLQILSTIITTRPKSIADLAKIIKKNFKNVHTDVYFLAELGLIELRKDDKRKKITPVAKYQEIDLPFAA